ncbi:hypothetical protein GQ600_7236 [Phytophthora cactorum]|nr:hypothetical protein GQ600_7236 [Phytophthora cactorum]
MTVHMTRTYFRVQFVDDTGEILYTTDVRYERRLRVLLERDPAELLGLDELQHELVLLTLGYNVRDLIVELGHYEETRLALVVSDLDRKARGCPVDVRVLLLVRANARQLQVHRHALLSVSPRVVGDSLRHFRG